MLPSIDDGARDLDTALKMARIAVEDGITHVACSPHIYPGMYENSTGVIQQSIDEFAAFLRTDGIALELGIAADVHLVPEVLQGLKTGRIPTINNSRYFLLEPPHHVAPPRFNESLFDLLASGYIPVITHPERLSWVGDYYDAFLQAVRAGAWIQLTAGSISGRFGEKTQRWSEQMLDDGIVHIIATDAHNVGRRSPFLREGMVAAAKWVGDEEARLMVFERPRAIWNNDAPATVTPTLVFRGDARKSSRRKQGFWNRLFG